MQDDYIATGPLVRACSGSARTPDFVHVVEGGNHEPIVLDVMVEPGSEIHNTSRRKLNFDKAKLKRPDVASAARAALAQIPLPSIELEQASRSHIVAEAIRNVLEEVAPKDKRTPKQHWVSARTVAIIEAKHDILREIRHTGRALKKLVSEPLNAIRSVQRDLSGGWISAKFCDSEAESIDSIFKFATHIRE